jgi:hypothetical protein
MGNSSQCTTVEEALGKATMETIAPQTNKTL